MKQFYANGHVMPIPDDITWMLADRSRSTDTPSAGVDLTPLSLATPYLCTVYAQGSQEHRRMVQQRHKLDPSLTQEIKDNLIGNSSVVVRPNVGLRSRLAWSFFDRCSTAVRPLFDSESKPSRSGPEGLPKKSRRSLEHESKRSRRAPEGESRDVCVFTHRFSSEPVSVPRVYAECTGSVLKRYQRGTTNVLERYYRGTKNIPAACTPIVGLGRDRGGGTVSRAALYLLVTIFVSVFICFSGAAQAQSRPQVGTAEAVQQEFVREINGIVVDALTEEPLVGVSLIIYVDSVRYVGRASRDGGRFDFRGTHITHGVMKVNHKGYIGQEIQLSPENNGPYHLALQPDAIAIEEVEVISTGYFSVPKERATGSFTHIDQELFSRSVGSNVIDRLKDNVPGLTFNQRSIGKSTFFNEPSISIRGRSTIRGNAEPLIILDNFPYEGDLNDINPEDIESVTILQDAAAASIWGARAGNGVIVLTSKSGKLERPLQMAVRSDFSISAKPDLYYTPTMSMDDFIEVERFLFDKGAWNAYINQGYSYITPAVELLKQHRDGSLTDTELETALDVLKGQDVRRDLEKYFYRPASLRKVSASFDGGGRSNTYYFSAGYDENRNTQQDSDNKRISLNAKNSYRLWEDKLQFDMGLMFSRNTNNNSRFPGGHYNVLYDRLADEFGNPLSIGGGSRYRHSYIDTAGNGLLKDWNYRPLEELGLNNFGAKGLTYQLSTGLQVALTSWLGISGQYRYNSGSDRSDGEWDIASFQMRNLYNQFSKIDHSIGTVTSAIPNGGQLNTTRSMLEQHSARFQFNADKFWNEHQLAIVGGSEINSYFTLYEAEAARLGYQPGTETFMPIELNIRYPQYHINTLGSLLVAPTQPTRETTNNRNVLLFGNASYTYDQRYTATFSVRKDAANIFGVETNRRGKPFWSSGLLWHMHNENFVDVPWLQKLSLRATHGSMGNVSTASAYLTSMVASSVDIDSKRVYQSVTNPPNPLLSWEKIKMTNFAIDFTVLQGKLSGSVERYFRSSTDLLSQNPMNPSSGVSSLYGNWSSMKASGWDASIVGRPLFGEFSWSWHLIFSHINDVVTEYVQKPSSERLYLTSNLGQYPIEGKPLYGMYSFRHNGLDDMGDPLGYMGGEVSKNYSAIYNNTPLSDYVYHGRATPSNFGSLRNTLAYRGVELSLTLSYHFGYYFRQQALSSSQLYSVLGYGTSVFQSHYAARWQRMGDEVHTRIPAIKYPVNSTREAFYGMVEDHVQSGDHIRFKDIRLSYNIQNINSKEIKGLQVYGYIDNIGVVWAANELGYDPHAVPDIGLSYPSPITFAFGLNLKI